ncbi:unnamed protein product [Sphagnum balticum]
MNAVVKDDKRWNTSGLVPVGVAVLVEAYEPEIKKSMIAIPETVAERTKIAETRAIIRAIGTSAWQDEPEPRARLGDKVMIARFAGIAVKGPKDGKDYRIINDRDIFCRIEEEA